MRKLWKRFRKKKDTPPKEVDLIISPNEVNERHGTGVILKRVFGGDPHIFSLRSSCYYNEHSLGDVNICVPHDGLSRPESFKKLIESFEGYKVRRILCVPYFKGDLISAIIAKELFTAPLCIHVMDDQNLAAKGIPDELMREALEKADFRLAISPEMRDGYERKYQLKFYLMPPLLAHEAILTEPQAVSQEAITLHRGILVGSLWSREWLQKLRETVRNAGARLEWFGNMDANWLQTNKEELEKDGIFYCGFIPEAELTPRLKDYAFAVIPSGTLDEKDDRPEIAKYSLPTRIPYLLAASNTPMLVLGSPNTAAARFILRLNIGTVADYNPESFKEALKTICLPENQLKFRKNAASVAHNFSAQGMDAWLWNSLENREPVDLKFEKLLPKDPGDMVPYLPPPVPKEIYGDFSHVYQCLRRLKDGGFKPDFVLDVGSSSGVWSATVHRLYPQARFVLVDPLQSRYAKDAEYYFQAYPDFERVEAAVSNTPGTAQFQVSADLYGSSLLTPADFRTYEKVEVPIVTLDGLKDERRITGRGLLKIDVQCAEHLVLEGAKVMLESVDALMLELSLIRFAPQAKTFTEMVDMVRSLGFRYYDECGEWRCPVEGTLLQKDVLFVRENLFVYQTS